MTDIAELGIRVESQGVDTANRRLDDLAKDKAPRAERATDALAFATGKLSKATGALGLAGALTAASVAMIALRTEVLQFSSAMREISTLVDTSTVSMGALSKAAIEQAGAFNSAPITQTKALYAIISAGATTAAQATETLTAANKLAVGGVTTVAIAADGLTGVLNAYGNKVAGAAAVSDALFIGMKAGKTNIAELSSSLGAVLPLAAAMGVSFDELVAATSALTKGEIETSVAVNGLRSVLAALAKPSDEAAKLAAKLGLEFNSAAIESKGLAGFLADLQAKTGGSTDALATLFGGVEALVPVMALSGQAGKDFASILDQMTGKAGATQEAFDKIASGPAFQLGRIFATLTANAIGFGAAMADKLAPGLKVVADLITGTTKPSLALQIALNAIAITAGGLLVKNLYGLAASVVANTVAAITGTAAWRAYMLSVALVGPASATATVATTALGAAIRFALGPVGLLITIIGILSGEMALNARQAAEQKERVAATTSALDEYEAAALAAATASGQGAEKAREHAEAMRQEALDAVNAARALREKAIAAAGDAVARTANPFLGQRNTNPLGDPSADYLVVSTRSALAVATEEAAKAEERYAKILSGGTLPALAAVDTATTRQIDLGEKAAKSAKDRGDSLFEEARRLREANEAFARSEEDRASSIRGATQSAYDSIAVMSLERDMLAATERERAVAIAGLQAEQEARRRGWQPDEAAAFIEAQKRAAAAAVDQRAAQDAYNESLWVTADLLADIDARAQDAARGMSSAFGSVGRAIGDVMTLMTGYAAQQEELAVQRRAEGVTAAQVAKIDRESARNRVAYYGDMLGAAKGFFAEQTGAYKAIQAVEMGYRAWQMAASIQAMVMGATETSAHVAQSTVKGTASAAAGAAKIFEALGPFGFPVVAAMAGVLASFGLSTGGGGSSGPTISQRRQSTQGTGSVLGDASAQSESIANSLALVAENTNRDLEYSNAMLRALRSIDDQIGAVAAALARSLGAGGALDTSRLKLGTSGTTPSLSNLGFSSSTTKKLVDQGIQFVSQSVADIIAGGIEGATYQAINTSKKKTVFGITLSSSSSTKTTTSALEADLQSQLSLLVGSLRDGVLSAASILGIDGAQATLDAFALNIGKISLKDMTGAEIEEAITAVFGKVADDMAGAVIPGLTALQNVGEGLFETLTRVARQYQVVDTSLKAIGMTFGATGVASLAARERLVDLFGSLDDFADQTAFFAENFLSEAERLAPIQSAVTAELTRLGLAGVTTRDQFKSVVQGLDLSTAAGASLFAALMSVAPAFDKVATASEEAAERLADAQARLAELQLEAADRATEAAISALDAISSAAGETSRAADSALQAAVSATADARQTLVTAYERERKALLDVVGAVDAARAVLTTAYERERNALLDVAAGVDTARANLTTAYEREREALLSVAAGIETAQSALRSAYEAQRQAMVSAYEAQRQAVVQSYEAKRQALTDQLVSVEDARSRLTSAYEAEAGALRGVIDKFGGFAKGLRAFRDELAAGDAAILGPVETLRRRQASFRSMAGSRTDEALGGGIESSGRAYLDAALAGARTSREYQRAVAEVMRAVSVAEVAAKRQADVPTRQLAALDASVAGLLEVQQGVLTVAQGIAGLQSAQQANAAVQAQITALDANHLAALATMDANHAAELAALDTQVGALIDIRDATLSVEAAIAGLAAAQAANATAQGQLAALDASVAGLINVSEGVLSVADALTALTGAQAANATAVQQLAALDASVAGLLAVNDNVISVAQAIAGLQSAQSAAADAQAQIAALDETAAGLGIVNTSVVGVQQAIADLLAAQQAQSVAQATADAATAAYQSASLAAQQAQLAYDADRAAREASAFAAQLAAAQGAVSAAQAAMAPPVAALAPETPTPAPAPVSASPAPANNDNGELLEEMRKLRALFEKSTVAQVSTAATSKKTADLWTRVTRDGEALLTEVA